MVLATEQRHDHSNSCASNDKEREHDAPMKSTRERTPAAPEEFEEFLMLYSRTDAVVDDRMLTALERILRCYASYDETGKHTPQSPGTPKALTPFSGRAGLRGLPHVIRLCNDKIKQGNEAYAPCLLQMLRRAEEPLNLLDVRDDRRQRQAVMRSLEAASECLDSPMSSVTHAAAKVIQLIISDIRSKGFDDLNPPPVPQVRKRDTRFKGLCDSEAIPLVIAYLNKPGITQTDSLMCLQAIRDCSCYEVVVQRLLEGGVLDTLMNMLACIEQDTAFLEDDRIAVIVETLWNIMDLDASCRRLFGTERHLGVVKTLFVAFLREGYRIKDKELRNDLLSVISLVAGDSMSHKAFLNTGWLEAIFLAAVGIELLPTDETYLQLVKPFSTTTSEDDFDMKKLLWHILYLLSFDADNMKYLLGRGIMKVPLSYLDPGCAVPCILRWPTSQLLELQTQSLNFISQLCIGGTQELAENNGIRILLDFLEDHASENLREVSLRVLARVATTENRRLVAEAGAVKVILELSGSAPDLSMRCDCLHILAGIAERDAECQQQFIDENGIDTILHVLQSYKNTGSQEADRYLFAAIDCVWCCIVGVPASELEFIESQGIHALMDILVGAPSWICVSLLSCIEDFISTNNLALAELLEWRGVEGKAAPQIFIDMWKRDDAAHGEKHEGLLSQDESEQPFASRFGQHEVDTVLHNKEEEQETGRWSAESLFEATTGSMTVSRELPNTHDIKVKIFCIFQRGFPSNSPAMMVLTDQERVQLQVILSYDSLKRDQVWRQINDTLKDEGLQPIGLDRQRLENAKGSASDRWRDIRGRQLSLQEANQRRVDIEQDNFYKLLLKKPASTVTASRDTKGLSITEAKIKKAQMLKRSFLSAAGGPAGPPGPAPSEVQSVLPVAAESKPIRTAPNTVKLEVEVTDLLNKVRADPSVLIEPLEKKLKHIQADGTIEIPGEVPQICVDGVEGITKAIAYLKTCRVVPFLKSSAGLTYAARDHIEDQRSQIKGETFSHRGSDGSDAIARMNRYGLIVGTSGEGISLGRNSAVSVVCDLVLGDGVDSKVDRHHVFDASFNHVGVACSEHPTHRYACVVNFAANYQNKPYPEQQAIHSKFKRVLMEVATPTIPGGRP